MHEKKQFRGLKRAFYEVMLLKEVTEELVLRRLEELSAARVNDAVKLAFLDGERMGEIDRLDLTALTEFKRSSGGAVEIRLTDRVTVLERIAGLLERQEKAGVEEFLQKMSRAAMSGGDPDETGEEP